MPSSASRRPPRLPSFPYTTLFRSASSARCRPRRPRPRRTAGSYPAHLAQEGPAVGRALEGIGPQPSLVVGHHVLLHDEPAGVVVVGDRKSTRLNSSHLGISYAVFCFTTTSSSSLLSLHDALPICIICAMPPTPTTTTPNGRLIPGTSGAGRPGCGPRSRRDRAAAVPRRRAPRPAPR